MDMEMSPLESMELLSESWCSSAIQVFQPTIRENSIMSLDTSIIGSNKKLNIEDDENKSVPQWKLDDLKSWIWLQQALHPELDYDACFRKKWFPRKFRSWTGTTSIKKWLKEMKQKRKDMERLKKAEIHAAISVAGVAAALAAIAAENNKDLNEPKSLKERAVAAAAALVAAQCAQVAQNAGAKKYQLAKAVDAAAIEANASNIITLTAAAATSLRGAAALRGRPNHRERIKGSTQETNNANDELEYDFGRCRAMLAKGDELLVLTRDGNCRIRSVSIILNIDGKVVLKIRKLNLLMVFSSIKESTVYSLHTKLLNEPQDEDIFYYSINVATSSGRIELKIDDYIKYKKWNATIKNMLMLSRSSGNKGTLFL